MGVLRLPCLLLAIQGGENLKQSSHWKNEAELASELRSPRIRKNKEEKRVHALNFKLL